MEQQNVASVPVMDPALTSSPADPEHADQNWSHKKVRKVGNTFLRR